MFMRYYVTTCDVMIMYYAFIINLIICSASWKNERHDLKQSEKQFSKEKTQPNRFLKVSKHTHTHNKHICNAKHTTESHLGANRDI